MRFVKSHAELGVVGDPPSPSWSPLRLGKCLKGHGVNPLPFPCSHTVLIELAQSLAEFCKDCDAITKALSAQDAAAVAEMSTSEETRGHLDTLARLTVGGIVQPDFVVQAQTPPRTKLSELAPWTRGPCAAEFKQQRIEYGEKFGGIGPMMRILFVLENIAGTFDKNAGPTGHDFLVSFEANVGTTPDTRAIAMRPLCARTICDKFDKNKNTAAT